MKDPCERNKAQGDGNRLEGYREVEGHKSGKDIPNQLEKLEAAKAARLVCLSLLSLTAWPYLALLSLT